MVLKILIVLFVLNVNGKTMVKLKPKQLIRKIMISNNNNEERYHLYKLVSFST